MDNWDRAIRVRDNGVLTKSTLNRRPGVRMHERSISNPGQGIGGIGDIILNTSISTAGTTQRNKLLLETLYAKFWPAAKMVDLKPDDAFMPGVMFGDDDQDEAESMELEMERLGVIHKTLSAVKASRVYGTAILILAPSHGNFMAPIIESEMMPGDISHLMVADRFQLESLIVEGNPGNPRYGEIIVYRWNFHQPSARTTIGTEDQVRNFIDIHSSRVIRFDGVPPITNDGWECSGDEMWGQSILVRAVEDIIQDKVLVASLGEVIKRASVPIIKMANFKTLMGKGKRSSAKEMAPEEYADAISSTMTSANILFMDKQDDVDKLQLQTAGLLDVVEYHAHRMAMIEGIPITRFTGESASGLNATGEGDARDHRITIDGFRKQHVDRQFKRLMNLVARSAGLQEAPEWKWGRLGESTDEESAQVAKTYAETVVALLTANIIDESEARLMMNESTLFDLDADWEPPPLEVQLAPTLPTKGDPKRPKRPMNTKKLPTTSASRK